MIKKLYRLVNRGLAGEPEDIVLQIVDGVHIIEITDIHKVLELDSGIRQWDDDLDEQRMFQKDGHQFYIHELNGEIILEL
jgi:hypothetical protein